MGKTNSGLAAYAKAQVGKPYWYGTFGQTATESLLSAKKAQYPDSYQGEDFSRQLGQRVHDCVGLIKGYIWSDSPIGAPVYNAAQDKSATGMYAAASEKGTMSSFPGKEGLLLFKGTAPGKLSHVGIYGGDGYVYEAKSHSAGVVATPYRASAWQYWAQCPYTESETAEGVTKVEVKVLKKGSKGSAVKALQLLLEGYGYSCGSAGADGSFGGATLSAVKAYQKDNSLTVDGSVGAKTWGKLLGV